MDRGSEIDGEVIKGLIGGMLDSIDCSSEDKIDILKSMINDFGGSKDILSSPILVHDGIGLAED